MQKVSVIFLHIPKTAGQSVHGFLHAQFRPEEFCPARENFQLLPIPIEQLQKYRLFSGHLDWSLLDTVPEPRFVFTVLRRPIERILSFYFYLRGKAKSLPTDKIKMPESQGLHAALNLTPDEYFCGGPPGIRQFIDNHYDNFYSYYFAGRTFDARQKLRGLMGRRDSSRLDENGIVELALSNLRMIDRVYTTEELDKLEADIRAKLEKPTGGPTLSKLRVNEGEGDFSSRLDGLRELGASEATFQRLEDMTRMDNKIWDEFSPK